MSLRFRKSIEILPGVKLNLNKNSHSWTFGGKGMHYTVNKKTGKATQSVNLPGGFSYTETKSLNEQELCGENKARENIKMKENSNTQKPFYKKKWFIAIVVIIVLAIVGNFMGDGESMYSEDPTIQRFADNNEITYEYAEDIFKVAEAIGMDVDSLRVRTVTGEEIVADYWDYKVRFMGKENKVTTVSSTQGVFYSDGKVENKMEDLFLTQDEWTQLVVTAQIDVEDILKSPKSAEHPNRSDYIIKRDGENYEVTSYVDADNSFGAKIRTYYIVKYKWDGNTDIRPTLQDIEVIEN